MEDAGWDTSNLKGSYRRHLQDRPNGNSCSRSTLNDGIACPDMQSPLPYMLAGLAAMILLVIISLIILACSYLKTRYNLRQAVTTPDNSTQSDQQAGDVTTKPLDIMHPTKGSDIMSTDVMVIMAGEEKPTHLAQPASLVEGLDISICTATENVAQAENCPQESERKYSAVQMQTFN
ncbi:hypothetical protein O6H91_02G122600 [Diphasiastrum complanatum]|uniref:Uncharacterized protein n=2 Tax=Diphasiastrum complanatum TaxID=34168 RepID=A0ACC2EK90_DIPCM|nr:hypothetical protein O6H91_02G122600 [Diphasiastrum complanatum]